ncbi:MAG TPA: hypothetical protein VI603_05685 [Saprospiraceae bacterium]|nr:hypothetical protein [Saprospiraceae bacterium]
MKLKLIIFLTLFFVIGYPACHCPDFYLITGIQKFWFFERGSLDRIEGGEIIADTLYIHLILDVESFTDAGIPDLGLMSSVEAFTFDCVTPLANSIESIIFLSSNDFNEIPAGQSLNSKLRNADYNISVDSTTLFFSSGQFYDSSMSFQFIEKPVKPDHTFKVVIVDNAGNEFTYDAQPLIWH